MTYLNLTERQVTIISIALTNLYDEVAKWSECGPLIPMMRDDIMKLSKYIDKETAEQRK